MTHQRETLYGCAHCGQQGFTMRGIKAHQGSKACARRQEEAAATDGLLKLARHIVAMADDTYLTGHPEWYAIVEEAKADIARAERGKS